MITESHARDLLVASMTDLISKNGMQFSARDLLAEINIVAVKYNNQLALSFHPELGEDNRIHKRFLQMVQKFSCQ